jgi:DNA-binding response OmpR family regulator
MKENALILIVEDNQDILNANRQILEDDGFTVITSTTLAGAREHIRTSSPDLAILDISLPDGDGLDFLPELRASSSAPTLFLTAKDKPEERLAGLLAGGIDYITKPYDIAEFRARVRNFVSLLKGVQKPSAGIASGSLKLDNMAYKASLNGEDMNLSPKEFALLYLFVTNEEETLRAEYLYEKVWGQPMCGDNQSVKTAVSRLRAKLDESEFIITTTRGAGYRLVKE